MCQVNSQSKNVLLDTIGNSRLLNENSLDKKTKKAYEKKRAAKALTKATMYRMFGLQSPINDDYRQAYMCNEYLFQNGNKITSNYCDKKCCTVCNRIKSAQSLFKYGKRILDLENLYLVTLTNLNVGVGELEDEVQGMFDALKRIKKNFYKKKLRINGYRTFECTYSFKNGFNPHFHYIVQGKKEAELLRDLWLKQLPTANSNGQNVKKVNNTKKDLLEVFKYLAKPVTKGYYSARAFDEIMIVAKLHRVTDPLGSIRGKRENESTDKLNIEDLKSQTITFKGHKIEVWKYVHELFDYVAPDGELLLGTPIDSKTLNAINVIKKSKEENNPKRKRANEIMYRNRPKVFNGMF